MKQTKKLTREQKILLSSNGYDPAEYRFDQELPHSIIFIHKETGKFVVIAKG